MLYCAQGKTAASNKNREIRRKETDMKCYLCKLAEAVDSAECLLVEHHADSWQEGSIIRTETMEYVKGRDRIGLCPDCMKKHGNSQAWGSGILILSLCGLFFGAILLAFFTKVPVAEFIIIGLTVAQLVVCKVIVNRRNKEIMQAKPAFRFAGIGLDEKKPANDYEIVVPLGDHLYDNAEEFTRVNKHLSDEMAKKIYDNLIATGKWKEYRTAEEAKPFVPVPDATSDERTDAKMNVLNLVKLVEKSPAGPIPGSPEAEEARRIGEKANGKGGIRQMRLTYNYFLAAAGAGNWLGDLDSLWDGIGEWKKADDLSA